VTYENPHESADGPPESAGIDYWGVELAIMSAHGDPVAIIIRNREAIAFIPCTNEEEVQWLKDRLTGTRRTS
jgi:hypothetical protein